MLTACRTYISQNKMSEKSRHIQKWISETRVRTEKRSKGSEIAAPTLNPSKACPHKFRDNFTPTNPHAIQICHTDFNTKKSEKGWKRSRECKKMDFRNSSQNREVVKINRDSRSHTKFNIRSLATLFSRFRF